MLAYFAYAHAHAISLVPFFRNIVSTEINQNRIALMLGGTACPAPPTSLISS